MASRKKRPVSILRRIGPGFVTGAADDDPSGIATYSQTGAQFGIRQTWFALFSFPFMVAIQEMCGRIGIVTGRGLAGVMRRHYSKTALIIVVTVLFVTNAINIGADLGAMASVTQLLFGFSTEFWLVVLTATIIGLEVFVSYPRYARFLKYLALTLFAYFFTALIVHQDWRAVAISTFIPNIVFTKEYLLNILALLGTTISPYLFFWQADEEVEEEIEHHELKAMGVGTPTFTRDDLRGLRVDTIVGMLFSNLITFFIIITAAVTLHVNGVTTVDTATQAAQALRPLVGDFAFLLFAIGIIGTGLLAVPVLAGSAAYAVSEAVNWKGGLSLRFRQAHGFYGVIAISVLIGLVVNFIGIPPFKMLYVTAVVSSFAVPPLLFYIMRIGNNRKIMGRHVNSRLSNIFGWGITAMTTAASVLFLMLQFH